MKTRIQQQANASKLADRYSPHARSAAIATTRLLILAPLVALAACLALAGPASAEPSEHPFEIAPGSFHFVPSSLGAGAHANWVTSFDFAHEAGGFTYNDARDIVVNLPTGFDASDTAVPTCTQAQLLGSGGEGVPPCPVASQVGQLRIVLNLGGATKPEQSEEVVPIYNMEVTTHGLAAELGYKTAIFTGYLQIVVRPRDLGLTSTTLVPPTGEVHEVQVTIWGDPAATEHNTERGETCTIREFEKSEPGSHEIRNGKTGFGCENDLEAPSAGIPDKPFLSNPTGCEPHIATMAADSWEQPGGVLPDGSPDLDDPNWSQASFEVPAIGECDRPPFEPSIAVAPSTRSAESPTGLEVSELVPQSWEDPLVLSTANLKNTTVALPEGMTANPGLAEGLGACTPAQYEAETAESLPGEGCPPESKVGSIEIETPLLDEKIQGAVYIATPYNNKPEFGDAEHPGGSLLALYVVAKDPARGILIKVAGKIEPNPVTGQLVTTFENTPQQPFSRFTLKFRPGATAPLISPPACGAYSTRAEMTPWSEPMEPRVTASEPFQITQGTHEGSCPAGGVPPFKPQVISGTDDNAGSTYSPFYLRILREDGEQEITRFSTTLPPGLTGNLSGIPFCPNASIEAARNATGQEQEEHPSCPQASEIGHSLVGAGVGSVLAQNPGKIYLAGPYNGAPLSIVSITSAKVGPFDLGTVVIRFALNINPVTAQVETSGAQSEAIPHIIKGIVVHVREIRVYMDREKFIINPTNCSPLSITDTIDGAGANFANPSDQVPVAVNTPFEAADCSSLSFKPDLTVSTSAKTSRADGASLTAKLTVPGGLGTQANISKVKVELPKQLPSRLTTLQKACTAAQFEANPAGCPPASIIGHAKAITPILPVPLEGPAYFVSHGGEAFPDLEVVLQGYGFTIDLTATTFISKAGVTSTTFKTVPDQPVTSFELTLPEGPYSALTTEGNLCTATNTVTVKKKVTVKVHGREKTIARKVKKTEPATLEMPTELVAQNGAEIHQDTPITVTGCPKKAVQAKSAKHTTKGAKKTKTRKPAKR